MIFNAAAGNLPAVSWAPPCLVRRYDGQGSTPEETCVKSLFGVSSVAAGTRREPRHPGLFPERRKHQRRIGISRRIVPDWGAREGTLETTERRVAADQRSVSHRRNRQDRRIGLSPDLDLFLLGF